MTSLRERVRDIATGKPPRPETPVQIFEHELEPADPPEIRGLRYFVHPRWGVLRPRPELEPDTRDWPPLPFIEERTDDERVRWARLYEIVDDATWNRLTAPRPIRASDPPPTRRVPVDRLTGLWTFRPIPDVFIAGEPRGVELRDADGMQYAATHRGETDHRRIPGKPRAATPAEMIERLARKQISLDLAPDGRLVARTAYGRINDAEREALHRASPLLAAYLAGKPLRCAWCPAQAVTLLEPDGVEACPEHAL